MENLKRYTMSGTHIGTVCIEEDSLGAWVKFSDVVEAQNTAHNSRVMQLPTLVEVLKHVYCAPDRNSSHVASVVASAYDFIVSRQQT